MILPGDQVWELTAKNTDTHQIFYELINSEGVQLAGMAELFYGAEGLKALLLEGKGYAESEGLVSLSAGVKAGKAEEYYSVSLESLQYPDVRGEFSGSFAYADQSFRYETEGLFGAKVLVPFVPTFESYADYLLRWDSNGSVSGSRLQAKDFGVEVLDAGPQTLLSAQLLNPLDFGFEDFTTDQLPQGDLLNIELTGFPLKLLNPAFGGTRH